MEEVSGHDLVEAGEASDGRGLDANGVALDGGLPYHGTRSMRLSWAQTDKNSCGAAALMVALAEFGRGGLSADREMDLWRVIRARQGEPGSMPGRIAMRAADDGLLPVVWLDEDRLALAENALAAYAAFDVATILTEHRQSLQEAAESGILIRREPTNPGTFLDLLSTGSRLLVAVVVVVDDGRLGLHWYLCRQDSGSLFIMDPAGGADTQITEGTFRELLTGARYIGAAVTIQDPEVRP